LISVIAGKLTPTNGFNGRVRPDTTVTGVSTAINFLTFCRRQGDRLWTSAAAKDALRGN
jgi:hypothetical protein